jgi:membrane protein
MPVVGTGIAIVEEALKDGARDSAASIAYFAFFSLFPLLLGLIAIAGFFLSGMDLRETLDAFLVDALPGSADLVGDILDSVVRLRGPAGLLSVFTLLWSASSAFGALSRAVNEAWGVHAGDPFYVSKLRYVGMCLAVGALFLGSAVLTATVEIFVNLDLDVLQRLGVSRLFARIGGYVASFAFLFSMFALLYKVMPRTHTSWNDVWPGALLAAVLLEMAKLIFVGYLENVANFEAVYGSLSSVIVLMLWLYVSAWIVILGAEFIYVRAHAPSRATGGPT